MRQPRPLSPRALASDTARVSPDAQTQPTFLEGMVFLAELALLGALAIVGARIGGPVALRIAGGVALPLIGAVVWGLFLAPRSARRLPDGQRVSVKVALFTVAAVLVGVCGYLVAAVLFWILTVPLLVFVERHGPHGQFLDDPTAR